MRCIERLSLSLSLSHIRKIFETTKHLVNVLPIRMRIRKVMRGNLLYLLVLWSIFLLVCKIQPWVSHIHLGMERILNVQPLSQRYDKYTHPPNKIEAKIKKWIVKVKERRVAKCRGARLALTQRTHRSCVPTAGYTYWARVPAFRDPPNLYKSQRTMMLTRG